MRGTGRGLAVEDRRVGWSSRIRLDLRKEICVRSSADALVGELRRAVGRLPETGAGRPPLDRQRETYEYCKAARDSQG